MDVWTKTPDGYCSEVTDLHANKNPPMPETGGIRFDYRLATTSTSNEGEIEFWLWSMDGITYTVYND